MSLTRKIQVVAAALGGFGTTVFGAILTFGWVSLTQEQIGAISLIYPSAVALVIAVAQVLKGEDPDA